MPSLLLYGNVAACSEQKLKSRPWTRNVLRTGGEVNTCPVCLPACSGTLKVALCLPVCLRQTSGAWAASETLAQPSNLTLGTSDWALAGRRVGDPISSGSGILSLENKESVLRKKKKDSLFYQEMVLKDVRAC